MFISDEKEIEKVKCMRDDIKKNIDTIGELAVMAAQPKLSLCQTECTYTLVEDGVTVQHGGIQNQIR